MWRLALGALLLAALATAAEAGAGHGPDPCGVASGLRLASDLNPSPIRIFRTRQLEREDPPEPPRPVPLPCDEAVRAPEGRGSALLSAPSRALLPAVFWGLVPSASCAVAERLRAASVAPVNPISREVRLVVRSHRSPPGSVR